MPQPPAPVCLPQTAERSNDFCSANGSLACCFIHDLTYDVYTQESVG